MIGFNQKLKSTDKREYWVTSDLHFFHKGILSYQPETRPWVSLEEMHEAIITDWNAKVKPDDIIFHLGDFSFAGKEKTEELISKLNGDIIWLLGNHDQKVFQSIKANKYHYLEVKYDDTKVCMMHYSLLCWNRQKHGSVLIHGHSHGRLEPVGRMLDVGWDSVGEIITLSDAIARCKVREIVTPDGRVQ